jgi:hypothetical protein
MMESAAGPGQKNKKMAYLYSKNPNTGQVGLYKWSILSGTRYVITRSFDYQTE